MSKSESKKSQHLYSSCIIIIIGNYNEFHANTDYERNKGKIKDIKVSKKGNL